MLVCSQEEERKGNYFFLSPIFIKNMKFQKNFSANELKMATFHNYTLCHLQSSFCKCKFYAEMRLKSHSGVKNFGRATTGQI